MVELFEGHCQKMGPVALFELTEGDGKGMIRTGIEHNYSRIAEVNHPKRVPPKY